MRFCKKTKKTSGLVTNRFNNNNKKVNIHIIHTLQLHIPGFNMFTYFKKCSALIVKLGLIDEVCDLPRDIDISILLQASNDGRPDISLLAS